MSDPTHTRTHPPADHAPTTTFAPDDLTVAPPGHAHPPDLAHLPDGYTDLIEIGHGGMGVVYRARELMFDRPVAVKLLHPRYAPDSDSARRFVDEAGITAQLQHPGIPPVHRVGHLADGRPFLAMKLIGGRNLADLFAALPDPAHDRGQWLATFESVCQAVGFAHANGVIHRDLKPHNVMVGTLGEVQVMDWGLAKRLASRDREGAGERTADTEAESGSDLTQAGAVLGTPSYMAPEQARGEPTDARADVYALGCILCELLTGTTPHTGTSGSVRELLARVASGDVTEAFARLDASGADADLITLAKRCLAADPAGRPADAGELAAALGDQRGGVEKRLREAEIERARADEQLRRRRLRNRFLLSIAALLVLVQGLGWWVYETTERNRDLKTWAEVQKMQPVNAALAEVKALREQGLAQTDDPVRWRQTLDRARTAFLPAEELLKQGFVIENNPQPELLARDEADCDLLLELDRLPELNEIALFAGMPGTRTVSDRYTASFRKAGFDLTAMTDEQAVSWLRGHRFRERLTLALRDWVQSMPFEARTLLSDTRHPPDDLIALVGVSAAYRLPPPETRQNRLRRLADEVSDPFAREWWQAVQAGNWDKSLTKLAKRPEVAKLSSRQLASLAAGLTEFRVREDPQLQVQFEFLQMAYGRFPAEFWTNYRLAKFYQDQPKWKVPFGTPKDEALRHLTAAVAARPASAFPRVMLALHLVASGREVATIDTHLKNAIAVDPTSAWPHLILGSMYAGGGNPQAAIDSYVAGIRADPDTGFALISSFLVPLRTFGGSKDAIYDRLVAEFPDRCESWLLRSNQRVLAGDLRGQLADLREADRRMPRDHPQRVLVNTAMANLTRMAAWEERLPELLAGGPLPEPAEWFNLAAYCAKFDKNYAWAAEFVDRGFATDTTATQQAAGLLWTLVEYAGWPHPPAQAAATLGHRLLWTTVEYTGWALTASDRPGLGDAERSRYRRMALRWMTACAERQTQPIPQQQWNAFVIKNPMFQRYTTPTQLQKQPADEQALWERFVEKAGYGKRREVLPAPRREYSK